MRRTVPDFERITSDCVVAPPARYCTPRSRSPLVTPVAQKKMFSPRDQVAGVQDAVEVVARGERLLALLVVLGPQPALERAAHARDRRRRDDPLGGAADPEQQVDVALVARRGDRAGDVAVGDEADAGARVADLLRRGRRGAAGRARRP